MLRLSKGGGGSIPAVPLARGLGILGFFGVQGGDLGHLSAHRIMGLDRDSLAAHRAELEASHSRKGVEFKLLAGEVAALISHFDTHDMDVDSVHYDVDASDEDGWKAEWEAFIVSRMRG